MHRTNRPCSFFCTQDAHAIVIKACRLRFDTVAFAHRPRACGGTCNASRIFTAGTSRIQEAKKWVPSFAPKSSFQAITSI